MVEPSNGVVSGWFITLRDVVLLTYSVREYHLRPVVAFLTFGRWRIGVFRLASEIEFVSRVDPKDQAILRRVGLEVKDHGILVVVGVIVE